MAASIAHECTSKKGMLDPENSTPGKNPETPKYHRLILIGLVCFKLVLLLVIIALVFVILVGGRHFKDQEDTVLAAAHYKLTDPRLIEDKTTPDDIAAYTIQGYEMVEDSGVSVNLKNDETFMITKNGSYTIFARLTLRDNQKNAGMGIYIDDTVCDKEVTTVPVIPDPDNDTEYRSVVSLKVSCMDKKLQKGQLITIRSYHNREILSDNTKENRAQNWIHIQQRSNPM